MNIEVLKKQFIPKYLGGGEEKFYSFLIYYALNKLVAIEKGAPIGLPPDLEFLDYYEQFIILYRREGDEICLKVAKLFRKAAHRIYRIMLKKDMTSRNAKFLNLV